MNPYEILSISSVVYDRLYSEGQQLLRIYPETVPPESIINDDNPFYICYKHTGHERPEYYDDDDEDKQQYTDIYTVIVFGRNKEDTIELSFDCLALLREYGPSNSAGISFDEDSSLFASLILYRYING